MAYLGLTSEEINYLETLLRKVLGTGESTMDDGSDEAEPILEKLEKLE